MRPSQYMPSGYSVGMDSDYTPAEEEYLRAMAAYQKKFGRRYPTRQEEFRVFMSLGYAKPEGAVKPHPTEPT